MAVGAVIWNINILKPGCSLFKGDLYIANRFWYGPVTADTTGIIHPVEKLFTKLETGGYNITGNSTIQTILIN